MLFLQIKTKSNYLNLLLRRNSSFHRMKKEIELIRNLVNKALLFN